MIGTAFAAGPGVLVLAPILAIAAPIGAQEAGYSLILKDHKFQPGDIEIPAGKRIVLVVKNKDPTPEEFETSCVLTRTWLPDRRTLHSST